MFFALFCQVLQQAGRNPSFAVLNKYWTASTSKLNFDDFCEILKSEKKTEESDLLRAFKKMDVNGDGYISFSELEKALTTVSIFESFVLKTHCLHIVHAKVWAIIGYCRDENRISLPSQKENKLFSSLFLWLMSVYEIFQRGDKMSTEEVSAIFSLLDINKDGKLDYAEVSLWKFQVYTYCNWALSHLSESVLKCFFKKPT